MSFVRCSHPQAGTADLPEAALAHYATKGWTPVQDDPAPEIPSAPADAPEADADPAPKPAARRRTTPNTEES